MTDEVLRVRLIASDGSRESRLLQSTSYAYIFFGFPQILHICFCGYLMLFYGVTADPSFSPFLNDGVPFVMRDHFHREVRFPAVGDGQR